MRSAASTQSRALSESFSSAFSIIRRESSRDSLFLTSEIHSELCSRSAIVSRRQAHTMNPPISEVSYDLSSFLYLTDCTSSFVFSCPLVIAYSSWDWIPGHVSCIQILCPCSIYRNHASRLFSCFPAASRYNSYIFLFWSSMSCICHKPMLVGLYSMFHFFFD